MWLHFDCFSGISGDMTLGSLCDLGFPIDVLHKELRKLELSGYILRCSRKLVQGLDVADVQINVEPSNQDTRHRHFKDIKALIQNSQLSDPIKHRSLNVFSLLAEAEGAVHGCHPDDVHFHEVGAIDSIIDIVGVSIGLEWLGIKKITSSPLPLSRGFMRCQHGILPLPAPATLELIKGIPIYDSTLTQELVTPTGAAILASFCEDFVNIPDFQICKVGYGAGSRALPDRPNLLRTLLGQEKPNKKSNERIIQVDVNLDDMTPEILAFAMEKLLTSGALDVWVTPMTMKKGRCGHCLSLLCHPNHLERLQSIIFQETSSFGMRYFSVERKTLSRDIYLVETEYGAIRMKVGHNESGIIHVAPEFDDCRGLAQQHDVALKTIYTEALTAWRKSPHKINSSIACNALDSIR